MTDSVIATLAADEHLADASPWWWPAYEGALLLSLAFGNRSWGWASA
jgi:hypothetical protein